MKTGALLMCLLAAPGLAAAADGDEWYVTPFFGGINPDHARGDVQNSWDYGAAVGRELGPMFNAEINLNASRPGTAAPLPGGHQRLDGLSLDVLGLVNRTGTVAPYLGVGVGALDSEYSFESTSHTRLALNAELGLMVKLWEDPRMTSKLALRPEIRVRWGEAAGGGHSDYLYTIGLQYAFGGSPVAAPVPVAAAAPPPPPPPPPPAPPPPPPAPQAPLDSDHDGVPDSIDQCPNTPPGVQVDAVGCPIKGLLTLEGVNFATDKADLTDASRPILDGVAAGLKKHPRVKVEIQGHTDSQGKPAYNIRLSQRRAEAVLNYLVMDGVAADQVVAKGYGQTQPVASNATAEGRAKNRRVVMFVLANPGDVDVKGQGTAQQ
ncbi:MAG TPA: OmpA family protein [Steroidobacteraceae bacterium]|nr:OmpA family protein [Steroidobacteraceae bacterium]